MRAIIAIDEISPAVADRALRAHRFAMRLAFALSHYFVWIFIFQFFLSHYGDLSRALLSAALLFALAHDLALLLTPISGSFLRNGIRSAMVKGMLLATASFLTLAAAFAGLFGDYAFYGLILFAILYGAYRALYWIPYDMRTGIRTTTDFGTARELMLALAPTIAGTVLAVGYPSQVFVLIASALCIVISLIPFVRIPDAHEGYAWGFRAAFSGLLSYQHRRFVLTALADGISGGALLLYWPIAAFLIVGGSYVTLGLVLTTTFIAVALFRVCLKMIPLHAREPRSALIHATVAASSWILRLAVATPLGLFVVDSYYYGGNHVRGSTGIDHLAFDQSADSGLYIDELSVLKEMSLALGKVAIALLGVELLEFLRLPAVFVILFVVAALAAALSAYLSRSQTVSPAL